VGHRNICRVAMADDRRENEAHMVTMTQAKREFEVSSSLGKDVLLFNRMSAIEGLSQLFEIDLALLSPSASIDAKKILGTPVSARVEIPPPTGGNRYFHGLCTDFTYTGSFGELHGYRAVLRPWLWVLTVGGLPHLPEDDHARDHQADLHRSRLQRRCHQGLAHPQLSAMGVLRPISRDGVQLRQPAHGA
jgi:hypothetical protein